MNVGLTLQVYAMETDFILQRIIFPFKIINLTIENPLSAI